MDYSLLVWLLPTIALVVGVIIGFFVARALPNAVPKGLSASWMTFRSVSIRIRTR